MSYNHRIIAMIVCLGIILYVIFARVTSQWIPDLLTFLFGLASGWAFRETFVSKEELA